MSARAKTTVTGFAVTFAAVWARLIPGESNALYLALTDYKPGHHQRDREPVKRPGTSGRPELALGMLRLHGALTAPDIARLAGEAAAVTRYSEALRRLEKSGRVRRDGREKRGRVTAVRWALTLPGRYMFLTHLATLQS